MNFKKYNYNRKDIEIAILKTETDGEKLNYMLYLKKELEKVIYAFENTRLLKYREENNNCEFRKASELANFIEDLKFIIEEEVCDELNNYIVDLKHDAERYFYKTSYYKNYYRKELFEEEEYIDDEIGFGIREYGKDIEEDSKRFKITLKYLKTEIEYLKDKKLIIIENKKDNELNAEENRIHWNGTKTEFARMVVDEYGINRNKYRSQKKACEVLESKSGSTRMIELKGLKEAA